MLTRLFQELFSKKKPINIHQKTGMEESIQNVKQQDLKNIIESAGQNAKTASLSPENESIIISMASSFPCIEEKTGINIFVFHVSGAKEIKVNFKDVKMDLSKFDYNELLQTFIQATHKARSDAKIILVTQQGSELTNLSQPDVHIVELPLNPEFPMYERVVAMCSYVHSKAFANNTVFLDSDAFLTKDPLPIFDAEFDIALTFRETPGLMPINEGVIFANASNPKAVQHFFSNYLATYQALLNNPDVNSYYGDIRKWRGGQLSLNAQVFKAEPFSPYRKYKNNDVSFCFLPCEIFNYSFEYGDRLDQQDIYTRYVIHLKGARKDALSSIRNYFSLNIKQNTPTHNNNISKAASSDRKYSLDTTLPVDYEPTTIIDCNHASLTELADHFKSDKGSIKHYYTEIYSKYLEPIRNSNVSVLEVGVACGSSLKMWCNYFGEKSHIVGIDIRPECALLCQNYSNIDIIIEDAASIALDTNFDLIIDDGSHVSKDVVDNFYNLFKNVKPGGYYIIEDLKCTHDPNYPSLLPFKKTTNDFSRHHVVTLFDKLLKEMDYKNSELEFIHFYSQLAIMRKRG
jgi:hypothetical protein